MSVRRRSWLVSCLAVMILGSGGWNAASAQSQPTFELVEKAQPDQFYTGIGGPYFAFGDQPAKLKGQPKVNYDYIWGMDSDNRYVWFGTAANVGALGAAGAGLAIPIEFRSPKKQIASRAWEFAASKYPRGTGLVNVVLGDWRPPKIYRYDTQTDTLDDFTPNDPLINQVLGIRSVGLLNDVVICGGPTFTLSSICLFAFDVNTGEFLGSTQLSTYSNIRRWQRVDGKLYTGVQNTMPTPSRGSVLRWNGTHASPFQFETVGQIDNDGAYLNVHEGRLIVGTWPSMNVMTSMLSMMTPSPIAGLWVSPVIPSGGLTASHATEWKKAWTADKYEPDSVIAGTYAVGAMFPFGDYLYFGTIHYPGAAEQAFMSAYPGYIPAPKDMGNLNRAAIVLRAKNWGATTPTFELLYGDATLPVFTPLGKKGTPPGWSMKPNNMGTAGLYGESGFGDPTNSYLWSGAVHNGSLVFGTFSYNMDFDKLLDGTPQPKLGGDVYRFSSQSSGATALSLNGLGNPANHGIRNMVSTPAGLYLGTANGMNLLTNPNDNLPDGGWELRRLVE